MNKLWPNFFNNKHDCCTDSQTQGGLEKTLKNTPLIMGIIAAFSSSICCIGPVVALALFGVSAVTFITKFGFYFKALTILVIILGLIYTWYKGGSRRMSYMTILVISFIVVNLLLRVVGNYYSSQVGISKIGQCNDCSKGKK